MKLKRLVTGLIGFPLVVALLIFANNYVIDIVFSIVAILAMREFFNAFSKIGRPIRWARILSWLFYSICACNTRKNVYKYRWVICSWYYSSNVYTSNNE